MFKQLLKRLIFPHSYSGEAYKNWLRKCGVEIGEHTEVFSPNHTMIDVNRKYILTIGDYCKITSGVTILTHDYSRSISARVYGEYVGGALPVKIGDNVFIGQNATILMGTTIGNNCIVGAGAVVKGAFPDNVVIAGNPARVVCTLEEFYNKSKQRVADDAKRCALAIYERTGRRPTVEEMCDSYIELYMPHTKETIDAYPGMFVRAADDADRIVNDFLNSKPTFESFEAFLEYCGIQ